jgi:hypothetical protein
MGFFPKLGQLMSTVADASIAVTNSGASALVVGFKAIEVAAQTGLNVATWTEAQSGKMLQDLAAEVATERGWPAKTPEDLQAALKVLQSMGRPMTEADKLFLAQYSVVKIQQPTAAPTVAPTPAPTAAPANAWMSGSHVPPPGTF